MAGGIDSAASSGRRWLAAITLLLITHGAAAGAIFKCVDAHGGVSFQGEPCGTNARQTAMEVHEQPLIDPDAPAETTDTPSKSLVRHARKRKYFSDQTRAVSRRSHKEKEPVSYECRAADGEVFYRHSKCPASVPGDGIARFGVDQPTTGSRRGHSRSRGGAWNKVSVKAVKISRDEACRAINATAASRRDGHARDEQVSVYEHNLGRDPCHGF